MVNFEVLIPIVLFIVGFGIVYIYFTTRNKERMAMIEKGADPSIFHKKEKPTSSMKLGMLLVGVAIGIITGEIIANLGLMHVPASHFAMIGLFGGLALIIHHLIEGKKDNGED